MDIWIENGDFKVDNCGYPIEIYSIEEACQRVRFILSTVRGSFIYNRNLGADFSSIISGEIAEEDINKQAELLCREALAGQNEISIGRVSVNMKSGAVMLDVEVLFGGKSMNTEVCINE